MNVMCRSLMPKSFEIMLTVKESTPEGTEIVLAVNGHFIASKVWPSDGSVSLDVIEEWYKYEVMRKC